MISRVREKKQGKQGRNVSIKIYVGVSNWISDKSSPSRNIFAPESSNSRSKLVSTSSLTLTELLARP